MLAVPANIIHPDGRFYRDTADQQLIYVDQPALARRDDALLRWLPIPESLAYVVGEVRFGADPGRFARLPQVVPGQRLLPMPWTVAPVYVWSRQEDGVHVVTEGKTSGFGASTAVFSGTAPLRAMISPLLVAAELTCPAHLVAGQVTGSGQPTVVSAAIAQAALGARADWAATLGAVLVALLDELCKQGVLTLQIQDSDTKTKGAVAQCQELHELALLEWAHRIRTVLAPAFTLATPAALVRTPLREPLPDLALSWRPGSSLTMRAIRVVQPTEMAPTAPDQ